MRTWNCDSLFPYIGGNCTIIDTLGAIVKQAGVYDYIVEPFGGSAVFTLTLLKSGLAKRAILNDLSSMVYSVYYIFKHCWECIETAVDILAMVARVVHEHGGVCRPVKQFLDELASDAKREDDVYARGILSLVVLNACDKPWGRCNRCHLDDHHTTRFINKSPLRRYRVYHNELFPRIDISNLDAFEVLDRLPRGKVLVYLDPPHMRGRSYYEVRYDAHGLAQLLKRISEWVNEHRDVDVIILASPEDMKYYDIRGTVITVRYKRFSGRKDDSTYYIITRMKMRTLFAKP